MNGGKGRPSRGKGRPKARAKDSRKTLLRLVRQLRPERSLLTVVVVLNLLSVFFTALGPLILGRAIDLIFYGVVSKLPSRAKDKLEVIAGLRAHGESHIANLVSAGTGLDTTRLGRVLILAVIVYVLSSAFGSAQGYLMSGIALRTVNRMRRSIEEKLGRLPLRYFDSQSHGDTLSRVTNDIDNVNSSLQQGLNQLVNSVLTVAALLTVMVLVSPLLTVFTLATFPVTMAVSILIARRSRPKFNAQWKRTGQLNGLVEETHTGHMLGLAAGQRQAMIEEFDRQNNELYEASFHAQFLSGVIQPVIQFVGNLNYVVIAALGGYEVTTGALSIGGVQAFIQFTRRLTAPLNQIAGLVNQVQSGLASAERVFEFLDAPDEVGTQEGPGLIPAVNAAGHRVEIEHVSFRYNPDTPLIEDFTLEAAPGHTVAIVGSTGAGKTTLVNLLMRFYEIDSGRILLDGADYRDLSRDQVRSCFGMVLQDTWLFTGTVKENICYGKESASDEEIVAAAKAAYVDHFVHLLPHGYDTVLNFDSDSSISSGQKQLMTIARVFLANPGILILDEATSSVDTRTEMLVHDAMARLSAGRTSFVIAHRLSTIRDANTIVVMDAGRIVEQGSHQDLLSRRGFYYRLYNSQFTQFTGDSADRVLHDLSPVRTAESGTAG